MDLPLSGWGYGSAPLQLGIWTGPFPSPTVPQFDQFDVIMATRCIYVYFETGTLSLVHGDTFGVSVVEQFLPLVSSDLFCYLLWSLALVSRCSTPVLLGFGYPRRWLAFCTMGMWSWSMINRGPLRELDFFLPPTTTNRQPPTAGADEPPTANHCQPPPTTHHQPPTAANHHQLPPTASCQPPPTANRQSPPTMVEHMSHMRFFSTTAVQEHFFFFFLLRTPLMIKVVCESSIIDAPWTPSPFVSPVSSLHHHPHQFL